MAAKSKSRAVPGVKITKGEIPEEEWSIIHRFAVALEKGRFNDYIDLLQNPKKLLWKSFISGVGKGFGAIIGATIVVAIMVAILSALANTDVLPNDVQNFFNDTKDTVQQPVK